jgi:predicted transcriptional regulator
MGKLVTVRLDGEVAAALDREAQRTSRSKSRIVREALTAQLVAPRADALSALVKYAGIVKGTPDLSTNKAHLARLGKPRRP